MHVQDGFQSLKILHVVRFQSSKQHRCEDTPFIDPLNTDFGRRFHCPVLEIKLTQGEAKCLNSIQWCFVVESKFILSNLAELAVNNINIPLFYELKILYRCIRNSTIEIKSKVAIFIDWIFRNKVSIAWPAPTVISAELIQDGISALRILRQWRYFKGFKIRIYYILKSKSNI